MDLSALRSALTTSPRSLTTTVEGRPVAGRKATDPRNVRDAPFGPAPARVAPTILGFALSGNNLLTPTTMSGACKSFETALCWTIVRGELKQPASSGVAISGRWRSSPQSGRGVDDHLKTYPLGRSQVTLPHSTTQPTARPLDKDWTSFDAFGDLNPVTTVLP